MPDEGKKEEYKQAALQRNTHTEAVLKSPSTKKIVVAGPGTGKTTLFGKLLESRKGDGEAITLTFINALVDDLSLGLFGLSEVKTLHGFAATFLKKEIGAKIFPKLPELITEDAEVLLGEEDINFGELFHDHENEGKYIDFYKSRKNFYGKYYGFPDIVFALVKYLIQHKNKIPEYEQIIVDEFQDFNKVEVELIDLLTQKSPILIAGDDDQSLYIDLKNADPDHIRTKHGKLCPDYASFPLPYCSRCTRVIVDASNDIVTAAKNAGLLKNRIDKPYLYFPCESKDKESDINPRIVYSQMFEKTIPNFILNQITDIAEKERRSFQVLVIMPPQLKKFSLPYIVNALRKKGFKNIISPEGFEKIPTLLDGLKILLDLKQGENNNLAWRIIAKALLDEESFKGILKKTVESSERIDTLVDDEMKKEVKKMLRILKSIQKGKEVKFEDLKYFLDKIKHPAYENAKKDLYQELMEDASSGYGSSPRGIRSMPITITTVPSSKGLSADYVFITHFDDNYYTQEGKGKIDDKDVFNLLVALTRAKKKAYLISTKKKTPQLLKLIKAERIETI